MSGERLVSIGRLITDEFRKVKDVNEQWDHEYSRFSLWADNLGLHHHGHSSLDYRVREAAPLKRYIASLLNELLVSLKDAVDPVIDRPLESSSSSSSSSSEGLDDYGEDSPLDVHCQNVSNIINRLFRLSTKIRNPSNRLVASRASKYTQLDGETGISLVDIWATFDRQHVEEFFWDLRRADDVHGVTDQDLDKARRPRKLSAEDMILVDRFSRANTLRRKQFGHWRRHKVKSSVETAKSLTQPLPVAVQNPVPNIGSVAVGDGTLRTAQSTTTISRPTTATLLPVINLQDLDDAVSTASSRTTAPTANRTEDDIAEIPPVPKSLLKENFFSCPYCLIICSRTTTNPKQWREHVLRDLRAYVCTYADCPNGDQLYDSWKEWSAHEISMHNRAWKCVEHSGELFENEDSFKFHMTTEHHMEAGDLTSLRNLANASVHAPAIPNRPCPFCHLESSQFNQLQAHIATHLQRLALFALPNSTGLEDGSDMDSDRADFGAEEHDYADDSSESTNDVLRASTAEDLRVAEDISSSPKSSTLTTSHLQRLTSAADLQGSSTLDTFLKLSVNDNDDPNSHTHAELSRKAQVSGIEKLQVGDWRGAVQAFTDMIKHAPNSPLGYTYRAEALIKLQALRSAVQDCDDAIKRDSSHVGAYLLKAEALFDMGEYVKCLESCEQAQIHDHRGQSSQKIESRKKAAASALGASRIPPDMVVSAVKDTTALTAHPWSFRKVDNPAIFPIYCHATGATVQNDRERTFFIHGGKKADGEKASTCWSLQALESDKGMMLVQLQEAALAPAGRIYHAAVITGNAFIIWGGRLHDSSFQNDTERSLWLMNTETRSWQRIDDSSSPGARFGHSMTLLGTSLYVFGGWNLETGQCRDDFYRFDLERVEDPQRWRWEQMFPRDGVVPPRRSCHAAVAHRGKLYIFGGREEDKYYNDLWEWDPEQQSWSVIHTVGPLPTPRAFHAAAIVGDHMFVSGGWNAERQNLLELCALDVLRKQWYTLPDIDPQPSARHGHSMIVEGHRILLFGGYSSQNLENRADLQLIYVLDTSKLPLPMNSERRGGSTVDQKSGPDDSIPLEVTTVPAAAALPQVASESSPEYLNVPWGKKADVLQDLAPLCEIIDSYLQRAKKVLVHSKTGSSRSAVLVIAYGLWKGYQTDVWSMYSELKKISRWVAPGESFTQQLVEFESRIARGEYAGIGAGPRHGKLTGKTIPPLSLRLFSEGYPSGPVCVYESGLYIYRQPTPVEARDFDVVINVAREIQDSISKPSVQWNAGPRVWSTFDETRQRRVYQVAQPTPSAPSAVHEDYAKFFTPAEISHDNQEERHIASTESGSQFTEEKEQIKPFDAFHYEPGTEEHAMAPALDLVEPTPPDSPTPSQQGWAPDKVSPKGKERAVGISEQAVGTETSGQIWEQESLNTYEVRNPEETVPTSSQKGLAAGLEDITSHTVPKEHGIGKACAKTFCFCEGELNQWFIDEGEVITILERTTSHSWLVMNDAGQSGQTNTKDLEEILDHGVWKADLRRYGIQVTGLTDQPVSVTSTSAYDACDQYELSFPVGASIWEAGSFFFTDGWAVGQYRGKKGLFPAHCVSEEDLELARVDETKPRIRSLIHWWKTQETKRVTDEYPKVVVLQDIPFRHS